MMGNWSFGDYFKREAIDWAFELLVNVYKLPVDRLYATYFGGNEELNLPPDEEAKETWYCKFRDLFLELFAQVEISASR